MATGDTYTLHDGEEVAVTSSTPELLSLGVVDFGAPAVPGLIKIGQEIVRTLVGAIGLVLAVPITTALAVFMAPKPEEWSSAD